MNGSKRPLTCSDCAANCVEIGNVSMTVTAAKEGPYYALSWAASHPGPAINGLHRARFNGIINVISFQYYRNSAV